MISGVDDASDEEKRRTPLLLDIWIFMRQAAH